MSTDLLNVLLVGASESDEMEYVGGQLCRLLPAARWERAEQVSAALARVATLNWYPDLVIVCQRWPDEFPSSHVARLIGTLPCARLVCCYGPWCTADGRTRMHWPLAVRVPVSCATARIRRELDVLAHLRRPLPVTASRDEIFGFETDGARSPRDIPIDLRRRNGIQVVSADRQLSDWIIELLTHSGLAAYADVNNARTGRSDVRWRVWDVDPWEPRMAGSVRRYCHEQTGTAVVALMGFDHPSDVAEVLHSGVVRTVSKCSASDQLIPALRDTMHDFARWNLMLPVNRDSGPNDRLPVRI